MTNLKEKKLVKNKKIKPFIGILIAVFLFSSFTLDTGPVKAVTGNLIEGGSFEDNLNVNWGLWQDQGSTRVYNFNRAYDSAFGYGSHCAQIGAQGSPDEPFTAILSTKTDNNKFSVDSTKEYFLTFYAKATQGMDVITYLQRADNYNGITAFHARTITNDWQKYIIDLSPDASTEAALAFVFGDMPDGAYLYIDGVELLVNDFTINTETVKGYIGDTKTISIPDINNYPTESIKVELPYYDNLTDEITFKKFSIDTISRSNIGFTFPTRTFAGVGTVYVYDIPAGQFNYQALPRITEFHPSQLRADEDIVIHGDGFIPMETNTMLVVKSIDTDNNVHDNWISPEYFDSDLVQFSANLPTGIIPGSLYVWTSFLNMNGEDVVAKSRTLSYKVKPVIFAVEWSETGYEQVGDKLRIYGKGISKAPSVNFYNNSGEKIENKRAKLIELTDTEEVIEADSTYKQNTFSITVTSGGVESEKSSALSFSAKPLITKITSKYSRSQYNDYDKMPAAKIGEEITIVGQGLLSDISSTSVEFQGRGNDRLTVWLDEDSIYNSGKSLKVIVPLGAQNGYVNVYAGGEKSNSLPLEIVPSIIATYPDPILPGQEITIVANGMGENIELTKIYFNMGKNNEQIVLPYEIIHNGWTGEVKAKAPLSLPYDITTVSLQYDKWKDSGESELNVQPYITNAYINMDDKILTIQGYGFSIKPKENIITYKLADQNKTIIDPNARILGVYATEDGQEIRIRLSDEYYYGWVSVQVGDYTSNEANFGPVSVKSVARRIQYVENVGVTGVLYINGYNFSSEGGVKVGDHWADVHYRSDFFIIAVIDPAYLYDNPVIVAK
ncbi:hypothetical protein DRH27_03190 [Candidatus Falkowbacteria bacterium]|nr:MAG: hypothetical protein DRH27_03190 [Candidatus Falkowbacteria bacterium]